jgi:hypothetical protein
MGDSRTRTLVQNRNASVVKDPQVCVPLLIFETRLSELKANGDA